MVVVFLMQYFSNHVRIGSNWLDELLQNLITLRISAELVNLSSLILMLADAVAVSDRGVC